MVEMSDEANELLRHAAQELRGETSAPESKPEAVGEVKEQKPLVVPVSVPKVILPRDQVRADKLDADIVGNRMYVSIVSSENVLVKGWRVYVIEEQTGKELTDETSVTNDHGMLVVNLGEFREERPRFVLKVPPFKDKILTGKGPRPEEPRLPTFGEVRARVEKGDVRDYGFLRRPFRAWKLGRTMSRERGGM